MPRFHVGPRVDQEFGTWTSRVPRARRPARAGSIPRVESLEERVLLANIIPSGVISSTADGANFDYTIALTNSSASDSSAGTFWYAWVPGEDFLATTPVSVAPPTGWTDSVTNMGAGDGFAILFTASSSAYYVQPGSTLDFKFTSADTPASVNGNSVFFPGTPVGTSYVYPTAPFSDAGHQFVVAKAAATLSSIAVTPANPSVPAGNTEQFDAVGTFSDGSTQDLTSTVSWASATTTVASVSNTSGSQGLATALAPGSSTISATLDGITGSTLLTVSPAVLESINVTPVNPNLPVGDTEQFTATGVLSDRSTEDLTSSVTWTSSDTTWATVSAAGLATAVSPGPSTITATLGGIQGSSVLTVTPAALQSIVLSPLTPSVPAGETEQFTAMGTFSDHSTKDVTGDVTWASSTTSVATISNTAGSHGLAAALATGTSTISAVSGAVTASTVLTVSPAVLQSIALTPANPSVPDGVNQQFTAMGTFSDNSTQNLTSQVTWASGTTSVATISNATGSKGLASSVAKGTSTISVAFDGVTGSTVFTVTAALVSIAVKPANPTVPSGETEPFTATGTLSDGTTEDLTGQVSWSSATTAVASISSAAGSQGLASGLAVGTSVISASLDGVSGSTVFTVSPAVLVSIAVSEAQSSILEGTTDQFTATGTFSDRSTADLTSGVTWASSDPAVASISTTGLASGLAPGSSAISATLNGVTGSMALAVSAPAPVVPLVTLTEVVPVLNKRHLVTRIEVFFSGVVNATEAHATGTYRLAYPGKKGSFTAKNAVKIKLKSAVVDAADNMVTLTPKKAFALGKPVQLQVSGSLEDSIGRLIDGDDNGAAGGAAIAVIRKKGVTLATPALAVSTGAAGTDSRGRPRAGSANARRSADGDGGGRGARQAEAAFARSLVEARVRPSRRQVLFHLVEADHPDTGLNGLRSHVFEAALRRNAQHDFRTIAQQPDRSPRTQSHAGLGAERGCHLGHLFDAQVRECFGDSPEDLVDATGRAHRPPSRQPPRDGRGTGARGVLQTAPASCRAMAAPAESPPCAASLRAVDLAPSRTAALSSP